MTKEILNYPTLAEACLACAEILCQQAEAAVSQRGIFTLVLSGGRTPRPFHEILTTAPWRNRIPWHSTHFFLGDERWVPDIHPDSNYGMARDTLLTPLMIPAAQIHPMPTSGATPAEDADRAETMLQIFFNRKPDLPVGKNPLQPPVFDLVLLGLGPDGHTASLFPAAPVLEEQKRWVAATEPGLPPLHPRLTLTLPVLNRARRIVLLTSGQQKKRLIQEMITDPERAALKYPAARLNPEGRLIVVTTDS